ncbi:GntR family transcriptional regulator [Pseudoroseomonas rhizosphaerae]|uniref:GntR family transcriptional regulator n=1 Tax=Teichococcus rhizosphaerae TaxID=1335062 RepID=A0A2C7ACK7_9PROT|nr:FadR/GntR family transcriptional regulator [Pseudoroseomonas rhizosphaerae]PHK95403.1 GntR family transcriptional regulator [Pseudoroseomonas rhizosphaerae]
MRKTIEGAGLEPARAPRLGDRLYGRILEQIISGHFQAGDKLPSESQICQAFGVSRPTVREALTRLHADGLVTTRRGSGTFVLRRPPGQLATLAEASDVAGLLRCMEVRMALEDRAAGLAARRRTPRQMEAVLRALDALRASFGEAAGALAPARADYAFHHAVASASGNALFAGMLEMLHGTMLRAMDVSHGMRRAGSAEWSRRIMEEHEAVADAIRRQDAEGASLAMRHHLYHARRRVTEERGEG